jgi:spoIIIJ-associated protein
MSDYQEFTGKTVEEALRKAREEFGVTGLSDLDFEILTQGSRGVLGMGAEPARIIAAPRAAAGLSRPTPTPAPVAPREASPPPRPAPAGPPPAPPAAPRPAAEPRRARPSDERSSEARSGSPRGDRRRPRGGRRDEATALTPEQGAALASERAAADREEIGAAEASPEALAAGKEILEQLVGLMGYRAAVRVVDGATPRIDVQGADDEEREALGALIGRKGERLSALQHLVNLMLSRRMGEWTRVLVDVEDYRGRRERQLEEVARRAADRVLKTGTMLQLEPMSALERRWIHLALRDVEGVTTQSIGEEPMRRVVVIRA